MDSIPQKRCSSCGQEFPDTNEFFFANKRCRNGLMAACKTCAMIRQNKYKDANRDKINAGMRDWHRRNPTKQAEYSRRNRIKHPEIAKEKGKKWRDSHKQHQSDHAHSYYLNNRNVILERNKKWHDENPHFFTVFLQKRRNKEREGIFTVQDWRSTLKYWDYKCAVCGRVADFWSFIAIDHWKPISKGGLHIPKNIVPLCHAKAGVPIGEPCCNNSKGNKDAYEWMVSRFGKRFANKRMKAINDYFNSLE